MLKKRFGLIALILCIVLTIGYFTVNTGAVSTVLLAIQGAITDGNLVKFSGTNGIGVDTGLSATNVVKCKFDATSAPTVNNDIDEGYTVGSRWIDITNDKEYACLDNTDGAAVWTETTGAGGGATTFLGLTDTPAAYTDQAGKYTKVNVGETALEFGTPAGAGTVTTSGTPVANDIPRFTDETVIEGLSYAELKVALDLEIGTDLQAYDAGLLSLAGLTYASDSFIKVTATDTYAIRTYAEVKDDLDLVIGTDVLAQQTIGIANDNLVEMDDTDAAVDDYCKLTANGLVGRSYSEVKTDLDIDLTLYYLKTEIDTLSKLETIYTKDIIDSDELAALKFTDLDDTPAAYDNGKYAKSTVDGLVWDIPSGGYTNLTSFVDQTAWRLFYSNTDGDVVELDLGTDGQYLKSTGATSAPTFDDPGGAGDMLKATYDIDEDGDIDVAAGGTEKSSWTQYAIPYLSGTTAFGEIPIGTDNYALTVNGATGYDWTHLQIYDAGLDSLAALTYVSDSFIKVTATDTYAVRTIAEMKTDLSFMTDLVDDVTPQLGEQLQAGAHSINFTEQVLTSGTAIAWDLGNSNKATLTAAHNFTITITAPSGALNAQLIITQDGTGTRVMDEIVTQTDTAIATTDVHADTEIIDLVVDIPTGARIRFKTSAADLPDPLVVDTIYWAIRSSENHIKVSTTKANAIAGTAIDITDQGSGTHTVQQLVKWTGGTLGVLSIAAGAEDILSLTYKTGDKQWYAQLAKNFY